MARPLLDALRRPGALDTSSLMALAPAGRSCRRRRSRRWPSAAQPDRRRRLRLLRDRPARRSPRRPSDKSAPLASKVDDRTDVLDDDLNPSSPGSGVHRAARPGGHACPLGLQGRREVGRHLRRGRRQAVGPARGPRAVEADGTITVLGRGSQCINTGGEKVYPEEVEGVLKAHPAWSTPSSWGSPTSGGASTSPRWSSPGPTLTLARRAARPLPATTSPATSAPSSSCWCDPIVRSPSGKADYRWAKDTAAEHRPA